VKGAQKTRLFRPNRKVQKNPIQQSWHNAMLERDFERLMEPYAEESVLESSAILVVVNNVSEISESRNGNASAAYFFEFCNQLSRVFSVVVVHVYKRVANHPLLTY
jgi:hypothetical protein